MVGSDRLNVPAIDNNVQGWVGQGWAATVPMESVSGSAGSGGNWNGMLQGAHGFLYLLSGHFSGTGSRLSQGWDSQGKSPPVHGSVPTVLFTEPLKVLHHFFSSLYPAPPPPPRRMTPLLHHC